MIISNAEVNSASVVEKRKEIKLAKSIQIIFTTTTTILLGLKLGGIASSIAFVSSAIATAYSAWYNIDKNNEMYISAYKYTILTTSLSREILFYVKTTHPLEEEKYKEYVEKFFNLKVEFEREKISLADDLIKNTQDIVEK